MNDLLTILPGDCRVTLATLPAESVQTCVTSPPYFGLRDYGTGSWEGGEDDCDHRAKGERRQLPHGDGRVNDCYAGERILLKGVGATFKDVCGKCGAVRVDRQIGLEQTPDAYVAELVTVFREVRRVLRNDGTLWLNLGDSMASESKWGGSSGGKHVKELHGATGIGRGKRPMSNVANSCNHFLEGASVVFFDSASITATAQRVDVALDNKRTPERVFTNLLGSEGEGIEDGQDDFTEVLNLLARPTNGVSRRSAPSVATDISTPDVLSEIRQSSSVIFSRLDANPKAELAVLRPVGTLSGKSNNGTLPVKKAGEPRAEIAVRWHSAWDTFAFTARGKGVPDVDLVNLPVALRYGHLPFACLLSDFLVTEASDQEVTFRSVGNGFQFTVSNVSHLRFAFGDGRVVPYSQLYDQSTRRANRNRDKQELGIPERVKVALQEDGWICRSTIIWHKPNPMPESVSDRPTKAHEYLFLLSKSPSYHYDAQAIAETADQAGRVRNDRMGGNKYIAGVKHSDGSVFTGSSTRNKRSVWTVQTAPYADAHFATFPPDLIKPCILAGSPVGGTVLDPFGGSGTTGQVALEMGRRAILCELNPDYVNLIRQRCDVTPGLALGIEATTA